MGWIIVWLCVLSLAGCTYVEISNPCPATGGAGGSSITGDGGPATDDGGGSGGGSGTAGSPRGGDASSGCSTGVNVSQDQT